MIAVSELESELGGSTSSNCQVLCCAINHYMCCEITAERLTGGVGSGRSCKGKFAFGITDSSGSSRSCGRSVLDEGALQVLIVGHVAYEGTFAGFAVDGIDIRLSFIAISDCARNDPIDGAGRRVGDGGLGVGITSEGDVEVDYLLNAGVGLADLVEFLRVVGDTIELAVFIKEEGLDEDLVNLAHFCSGLCLKVNLHERTIRAVSVPVHLTPEDEVGLACSLVKGSNLTQEVISLADDVGAFEFPGLSVVGLHDTLGAVHLEGVELAASIESG